ncbi:hypothetical protein C8T65DRAFT_665063 [Cerioporus squamosus]|nr:hypothetical protein C8T65DRAFT_670259 [Cerioporus squamosus]KAI0695588.1 hypothetical protein C8T65DRAFT_665063 [Cerioporus squamosus]
MVFSLALPLFALPLLAVATAVQRRGGAPSGSASCCTTTGTTSDPDIKTALGLAGIDVGDISGLVGLGCSPITVVGPGACNDGTTVTCTDNSHSPIDIGCVPVTL